MATKTTKKATHRKTTGAKKSTAKTDPTAKAALRRQKRIETDLENMEREAAGLPPIRGGSRGGARPKPLRSRLASKIKGRKVRHYVARGAVHLLIGGGAVMFKHGPRGAAVAGRWAGVRIKQGVVKQAQSRKWTDHVPAIVTDADGKRTLRRTSTVCWGCGAEHHSIQEMNEHFLSAHKDETPEPRTERKLPTIHKGATAKTAGKVIVKLHPEAKRGPARHRRNRRNPSKRHVDRLVSKYGATIHQIGERSMSTGSAAPVAQGFLKWSEAMPPLNKKGAVLDVQEMMAGMERAMAIAADAVADVARELKRRQVAPELVNAPFANMQDDLQNVGMRMTRFLANFNELYAVDIALARGEVARPSQRFFGAAAS